MRDVNVIRSIQVVNVRWYNATAWYGVTLAHALQAAGHPSLVVGLEGTAPLDKARELGLETAVLPLNSLNPLTLGGLVRRMDRLVRAFRPDVVNCHRGEACVLWALLKRRHAFALVRTRGDQRLPRDNMPNRLLHRRAADAVVATNSLMAGHFVRALGVPPARVHTVLGGVDTRHFKPDAAARHAVRAMFGFTDQDLVLGVVGRMDEVKGMRETVQALGWARSALEAAGWRPRLLLIGFSSQFTEADVERWSVEAGLGPLGERVFVTGRVDRPEDYINALDLGVLASLGSEAIARAALEIMACGVPLTSSRVGVMPDLLPEEYLFQPGDIPGMAAMLERGGDAAWRTALRRACFNRIFQATGLRLEDFRDQTLELYRAVLPGHTEQAY